jgi:hypothetical protein
MSFTLFFRFRLGVLWLALAVLLGIPFLTLGYFRKTPTSLPSSVGDALGVVDAVGTGQSPTIDGQLDDAVWSQAQPFTFARHPPANASTTATIRLLWDDRYLYAAFDVSDLQVEGSASLWDGDTVALIIDNGGQIREYRHSLLADSAGQEAQIAYILKGATTFDNPSDRDEGYSVEMAIPWAKTPAAGSTIAADLWSIDHDQNPGGKYNDWGTIFSKISWDGDQNVTTVGRRIRLVTTTAASSASQPVLQLSASIVLTFTSGAPGTSAETGKQTILVRVSEPGRYTLILENANPLWSGRWLRWDYLALKQGDTAIWEIGEDEAPPTYSSEAASELCDPRSSSDCTATFVVGSTNPSAFFFDLNDGERSRATVSFTLADQQTNADLTLVLSTLHSTHGDIAHFKMKVTLERASQL